METETIVLIVSIIIGLLACFMGYRLNKILVMIIGFYIGYKLGDAFLPQLISDDVIVTFVSIVIGIIIGFIAFGTYLFGVFILCFFLAYSLCEAFIDIDTLKIIIGVVAGVVAGIVGVKFVRPIIIITTSLTGGFLVVSSAIQLLNIDSTAIYIICGLILAAIGALSQFRNKEEA